MKLTGQHNQCPSCKLLFNSNAAFDRHRVGQFGKTPNSRHCMGLNAMLEAGMAQNKRGFWVTRLQTREFA